MSRVLNHGSTFVSAHHYIGKHYHGKNVCCSHCTCCAIPRKSLFDLMKRISTCYFFLVLINRACSEMKTEQFEKGRKLQSCFKGKVHPFPELRLKLKVVIICKLMCCLNCKGVLIIQQSSFPFYKVFNWPTFLYVSFVN